MDYERLLIKDYPKWRVFLHENQCYLGRCYIWAKREGLVDLMDANAEEREELFQVGQKLKSVLTGYFNPDLFNWAALGNVSRHCHLHLIPRYQTFRVVEGVRFEDARWGKNYAPYDHDFKLSEEFLQKIESLLRSAIEL